MSIRPRAFLIYVYTFYEIILLSVRGRFRCSRIPRICGIVCFELLLGERDHRRSHSVLRSAVSMSIKCGTGSKRAGYVAVFRLAAIAALEWRMRNRPCAGGLAPSLG